MGRGRMPMELIKKEKARKTTYQKRKNGIMKKVYEFSTLCGIDACIILYAPKFEGEGAARDCEAEAETWPKDTREVERIIEKYHKTTSDRHPRTTYDVEEYYKDRLRKVEAEISKVHKEKLKIMYPTWDDSLNALGEQQLTRFVSMLDDKLDACNHRINLLKQDVKGKAATAGSDTVTVTNPCLSNLASNLDSNPRSHLLNMNFNFMHSMSPAAGAGALFPPPPPNPMNMMTISDNNQLVAFLNPFQLGQSSQSSMLQLPFGQNQNGMQLMGQNGILVDWAHQVGASALATNYDLLKTDVLKEDRAEMNQNSLLSNYNGNVQTMQQQQQPYLPYSFALPNMQPEPAFQALPLPQGFQLSNSFYDINMLPPQMFDYMHGNK